MVRKFGHQVGIWQIENELNAARFAESFGWWRKGSLWGEDWEDGFQDQVWDILVEAIRAEDPTAKIIHDFHMFDIVDQLELFDSAPEDDLHLARAMDQIREKYGFNSIRSCAMSYA